MTDDTTLYPPAPDGRVSPEDCARMAQNFERMNAESPPNWHLVEAWISGVFVGLLIAGGVAAVAAFIVWGMG